MKEKIADYLLDISKLVFAGVVLGSIFRIDGISQSSVFIAGIMATIAIAFAGFTITKEE